MKDWFSRPANRWFVLVLVLWHGLFFVLAMQYGNWYLGDSDEYISVTDNMVQHGIYYAGDITQPWNVDNVSRRPPGYPLLIAAAHAIDGDGVLLALQALIGISTLCGVSLLLQRRFGFRPRTNIWLLIAVALFPAQVFYANFVMAEILFQALLFWCIFAAVEFYFDLRSRDLWLATLLLAAAILTKPVVFLLWVPVLLISMYYAWRLRRWSLVVAGLIPFFIVVGWSTLNYAWTGYMHFSSMKKINLLNYNAHALLSRVHGGEYADSVIDAVHAQAERIPDYAARSEYMEREATKHIMTHPGRYALLHAQGAVNLLLDPGRYDVFNFFGLTNKRSDSLLLAFSGKNGYGQLWQKLTSTIPPVLLVWLVVVLVGNVLLVVSTISFMIRGKCPAGVKIVVLFVVLYIVGITGHVGVARYKTAIFPLLLFTVPFFVDMIRRGSLREIERREPERRIVSRR
jgi:4-amino-4-deoxy-L-arabinose transferase-like glycosyltransferase